MTGEHVFKKGSDGEHLELIGNWEGVYRSEDDPWFQSASGRNPMSLYYQFSRSRVAFALMDLGCGMKTGLEFGCGLGYATATYAEVLNAKMFGLDASLTAVQKAQIKFPMCDFGLGDLRSPSFGSPKRFDFGILGQMLWYVLESVDVAIPNAISCIKPGGIFVVTQAFLKDKQMYGAEIADGFNGALSLFLKRFSGRLQLVRATYDDTGILVHNDGLLVFRVKG